MIFSDSNHHDAEETLYQISHHAHQETIARILSGDHDWTLSLLHPYAPVPHEEFMKGGGSLDAGIITRFVVPRLPMAYGKAAVFSGIVLVDDEREGEDEFVITCSTWPIMLPTGKAVTFLASTIPAHLPPGLDHDYLETEEGADDGWLQRAACHIRDDVLAPLIPLLGSTN